MRIAAVIWSLGPGGAERVMSMLANSWAEDHDVTLITLSGESPDHYKIHPEVDRLRLTMEVADSFVKAIGTNWRMVRTLRRAIRSLKPDVVVSFMDRTNNQVLAATRGMDIPVVVSERTDPRFHWIPPKARALRRVLYPLANSVVVQSESVASWCRRFVDASKVSIIPNPAPVCEAETTVRDSLVLGAGRLDRAKGFDILIGAFALVAHEFPNWDLLILGDGPDRGQLEDQVADLTLQDRVSLPGVVPEPREYMVDAGVFVLSSRYEGFPNVVLEAMSCGMPVIATDCPSGPGEIIEPGRDGILVRPEDPEALASAMRGLMADPEKRGRLGARARESVKRYGPEAVMAQWSEVIDSVVATRREASSS